MNRRLLCGLRFAIVALAVSAPGIDVGGCAQPPVPGVDTVRAGQRHFASPAYGVQLAYPGTLTVIRGFRSSYLLNDRWNPDAPADLPGKALLTLRLPGSNKIRTGEFRLGASHDPKAVAGCTRMQNAARVPGSGPATVTIAGAAFTHLQRGDAAMNHYRRMRSYRGVHDGACIAIDLVVAGTNPGVYDPPPPTPFAIDAAFRRLRTLLDGVAFSH